MTTASRRPLFEVRFPQVVLDNRRSNIDISGLRLASRRSNIDKCAHDFEQCAQRFCGNRTAIRRT
ncbi:MAG: hypothetical protein ABL999_02450 [Pyrinomonadaceae bacterium]